MFYFECQNTYRIEFQGGNLCQLKRNEKTKKYGEIATPDILGIQAIPSSDIFCTRDNIAPSLCTEEGTSLVWANVISVADVRRPRRLDRLRKLRTGIYSNQGCFGGRQRFHYMPTLRKSISAHLFNLNKHTIMRMNSFSMQDCQALYQIS